MVYFGIYWLVGFIFWYWIHPAKNKNLKVIFLSLIMGLVWPLAILGATDEDWNG